MAKDEKGVGFIIQNIKTEQFAIFEEHFSNKQETGLGTEMQIKFDQKNNLIGIYLGFEFAQLNKVFLKILVSCHFKIEQTAWNSFIKNDEGKIIVPKGFLAHLAMITTGTSRGVLHAKTESTVFSSYIIPTLNVEEMIPEDAILDIVHE